MKNEDLSARSETTVSESVRDLNSELCSAITESVVSDPARDLKNDAFSAVPVSRLHEAFRLSSTPLFWEARKDNEPVRDLRKEECSTTVESMLQLTSRDRN